MLASFKTNWLKSGAWLVPFFCLLFLLMALFFEVDKKRHDINTLLLQKEQQDFLSKKNKNAQQYIKDSAIKIKHLEEKNGLMFLARSDVFSLIKKKLDRECFESQEIHILPVSLKDGIQKITATIGFETRDEKNIYELIDSISNISGFLVVEEFSIASKESKLLASFRVTFLQKERKNFS